MENPEISRGNNVYPLWEGHVATHVDRPVHFVFRMHHAARIAAAWGKEAAALASNHVADVLAGLAGEQGDVTPLGDDGVAVSLSPSGAFSGDEGAARFAAVAVHDIGLTPLRFGDEAIHVSVCSAWANGSREGCAATFQSLLEGLAKADPPLPCSYTNTLLRADMALVAGLLGAVASDRLVLAWQPVRGQAASTAALYHEGLSRLLGDDGQCLSAGGMIEAVERVGLAYVLDRHVVMRVVAELMIAPDVCLAANISARSACFEGWWDEVGAMLARRPDVAGRLVIEITETAALPDVSQAADFVSRMRRLGVSIALDDFGVGHASVRQLMALRPDIVKIDRFFVWWAGQSERGRQTLAHLVGLANSLASTVIVEGVENGRDDDLVTRAGGIWRQGYHVGAPSVARPWKSRTISEPTPLPVHDAAAPRPFRRGA